MGDNRENFQYGGPIVRFALPEQMPVCGPRGVAAYQLQKEQNKVQPTTMLFRSNSGFGATLPMAAAGAYGAVEVISAGCSNGAEIDTVLGLAHRHMPGRRIRVLGLDSEATMLEDAATGRYHLMEGMQGYRRPRMVDGVTFDRVLSRYGMATATCPSDKLTLIDAARLRVTVTLEPRREALEFKRLATEDDITQRKLPWR